MKLTGTIQNYGNKYPFEEVTICFVIDSKTIYVNKQNIIDTEEENVYIINYPTHKEKIKITDKKSTLGCSGNLYFTYYAEIIAIF